MAQKSSKQIKIEEVMVDEQPETKVEEVQVENSPKTEISTKTENKTNSIENSKTHLQD